MRVDHQAANSTKTSGAGRRFGLIIALGLGVACGAAAKKSSAPELAAAGSARDDGSGLLAQASSKLRRAGGGQGYGGLGYTTGAWSSFGGFGGLGYSGVAYGGGIYANYRFAHRMPRDSDVGNYAPNYVVDEKLKTGRITGSVKWTTKPRRDQVQPSNQTACKTDAAASSDQPKHALVFLRKIKRGRGFPRLEGYPTRRWQVGGVIGVHECRLTPYVQVVGPIGGVIRAQLRHEGPDRLVQRGKEGAAESTDSAGVFDVRFTAIGDERIDQIRAAGPLSLTNDRGAVAWVMTADHPFYVPVDPDGSYTLLDVPVGSYELVAWHPPVPLPNGKLSAALEVKTKVTVRAKKKTRANLRLPRAK